MLQKLTTDARATIEHRALALAGIDVDAPHNDAEPITLADVTGGDNAHPALREAVREWWHSASADDVLCVIDAAPDLRARELAIVLCAEASAHLTDDPRVAECRRVRLAWVHGDATDAARAAAMAAARAAAKAAASATARAAARATARAAACTAARAAAWGAAWDPVLDAAWDAAWTTARAAAMAALATLLRALYPDPYEITAWRGLARWDESVSVARAALRK